jgi:tripartite-type tricarboxylate transporter receptor subunit TctC
MIMPWRIAVAALALLSCAKLSTADAQEWPNKPVRILIGFGAGGGTDIVTRVIAERLSDVLGQQFVVENRPGAGGSIAGGIVAKAPNDGYTAIALSTGHSVSAVMVKQVPYDPVKSFSMVGIVGQSTYVVMVPKNSPATDLKSLIEYVKQNPDKLNYSTVGVGATQHLIAEDMLHRTQMKVRHVSFRTTGEVVTSLLRGDVAFALDLFHAVRGQVESGDIRLLAVSTPKRWPAAPNVPTIGETLPGFGYSGWYGLAFPAGTPQPIVDKMHKGLQKVLTDPAVIKKLEGAGAIASLSTPKEFADIVETDVKNFRVAASKGGLQAK